jgi:hypothetical protein
MSVTSSASLDLAQSPFRILPVGAVIEAVKKLPMFTVQWSIVIFGRAFGAASIRNNARSATTDDK